ncbi:hypothetical protein FAIPA1_110073 [Frankia sp. AiPs1]
MAVRSLWRADVRRRRAAASIPDSAVNGTVGTLDTAHPGQSRRDSHPGRDRSLSDHAWCVHAASAGQSPAPVSSLADRYRPRWAAEQDPATQVPVGGKSDTNSPTTTCWDLGPTRRRGIRYGT